VKVLTERAFQEQILRLAYATGWLCYHTRPGRTRAGWRTPVQGHVGFPDLVLAHKGRGVVLFWELKVGSRRPTRPQCFWLDALRAAGAHAAVVTPDDWATIEAVLVRGADPGCLGGEGAT
jgi:hypothetical protein